MLAGVSFLATPVKFLAPSLDLPTALDVGRHTFGAFIKAEAALAALLALAILLGWRRTIPLVAAGLAAAIVVAEAAWLLPVLDARVQIILDGGTPSPSSLHTLYVVLESVKLAALALVGVLALRESTRIGRRAM